MNTVTRIAPSPTGPLHIGTLRTALFNFLHAKAKKGKFVLRIEDTDKDRSDKKFEDEIIDGFNWVGLIPDEVYKQSERVQIYAKYISKLLDSGLAYISDEGGEGKSESVVRLRNSGEKISFEDIVRGEISFDTSELGDFVIARDISSPLYHLSVVVDDYELGVTDVIRGEEHISNTPRQILIQRSLGIPRPKYAHIPLILAPDRSKLSKRGNNTHARVSDFKKMGYLPQALLNYLALLGWNPGTSEEIFSLDELVNLFDLTQVQKGGAIFNQEKLDWLNGKYQDGLSVDEAYVIVKEFIPRDFFSRPQYNEDWLKRASLTILERVDVPAKIADLMNDSEFPYLFDSPKYDAKDLIWKDGGASQTLSNLQSVHDLLLKLQNDFTAEDVKSAVWNFANEKGRGAVLWPMRFALTGAQKSPDPFTLTWIIGTEEAINRIDHASKLLEKQI